MFLTFSEIPVRCAVWRNDSANGSIAIANNKGDIGQPCRVPRETGKSSGGMLFVCTVETGSTYNSLTHDMNLCPKPNLSNVQNKYLHSTRSNTFSASNETTISGIVDCEG